MPRTRRKKGAAGSDSSGAAWSDSRAEIPRKKAVEASSRGAPTVHPGGEIAAAPIQGVSMVHPEETAASASRAALIRGVSMVHPGEMAASASPSQRVPMVQAAARAAPSDGGVHMVHPAEAAACSSAEMPCKKADLSSSGGVPTVHTGEGAMVYPGEWAEVMALRGGSEAVVALCCNTAAQDCEESRAKHHTKKARIVSSRKIPQEHCTEDEADTGLSGGVLQKRTSKVEADTSLSGEMLHEHPAKEADTSLSGEMLHEHLAKEADTSLSGELLDQHEHPAEEADAANDIDESDSDECVVDVKKSEWQIQDRHEAKLLIEKLNRLGLGEDISVQEFLAYYGQLASGPPWIDLKARLEGKDIDQQCIDHALCRFRYYKYKLTQPKEELHADNLLEEEGEDDKEQREYLAMLKEKQLLYREEGDTSAEEDDDLMDKTLADKLMDITEADFNMEFLEENIFFISSEEDGTLDWFFHPAYCKCASLSDYERLVPRNYGGTQYIRWSDYHSYLHSYDLEQEYIKYCEELSKQLKWMEDYIDIDPSSVKWDRISSRGAYQAIKIAATSFPKITPTLAYNGYYECKESMGYNHTWLKEYDDLYFEIWRLVKKGMSFRAALEVVCELNRFPLRQDLMQTALGHDFTMTRLEKDFQTCTAAIRPGVEEDGAKELIADAVKKRVDKPKFYDDYIRRKTEIAHIVGILPSKKTETDATV